MLVIAIKGNQQFSLADYVEEITSSRPCFYNNLRSHDESKLELVLEVIDDKKSRSVRRAINEDIKLGDCNANFQVTL